MTIGFIESLPSDFFCAIAFMTKKNTRIGAMPFNALIKRSPNNLTNGITDGA